MKCAIHPDVETNLSCGRCDKAICPRCLVQTPVGARCQDCARLYKLPTFRVEAKHYLRAIGAGLGIALACGAAWWAIRIVISSYYLNLVIGPGTGYAIGWVISLVVNHKRSTGLAIIGGAAVVVGYVFSIFLPPGFYQAVAAPAYWLFDLLVLAIGVFIAVSRLR